MFSDAAGTEPITDAVPVLNHEAVVGGFARAHDIHGDKAPDKQVIIIKQLMEKASSDRCKERYMPQGRTHTAWG